MLLSNLSRKRHAQSRSTLFEILETRRLLDGEAILGDIDGDGDVAFADFLVLSKNFGNDNVAAEEGDINGDGTVTFADFLILSGNFGLSSEPDLVWGKDDTQPDTSWTKPDLLAATTDPIYGTSIRRVTDATGTRFDRNTYSRRQAENADGSQFMTYHGDAAYRIYDRVSGALVRQLAIHPDAEPQWHPTNPDKIRHILGPNSSVGSLTLLETDVNTEEIRVIADLTARIQSVLPNALYMKDRAEGSPSRDGSNNAWIIYDNQEDPIGIVSYSLESDTILGIRDSIPTDVGRLDWVSASATGKYVVAGFGQATIAYDRDMTNPRNVNFKADHSDLAIDADGNDAYVYVDFSSGPDAGWIVSVDLDTLQRTRLVRLYGGANTSVHISGKGYDKPGWVMISTYSCKNDGAWSCDKVFALELAPEGRLLNLAHTYNCGNNYWTETHGVVNRDFTRVYFNSDGGSCGIDAEVYEMTLPEFE